MNRSELSSLLRNPGSIGRGSLNELREVLQIFPWFQSAHLLILKGLKNTDDVKFDIQLRESAPYISDRSRLYYLLNYQDNYKRESQLNAEPAEEPGECLHDDIEEPAEEAGELLQGDTLLEIEGSTDQAVIEDDDIADSRNPGPSDLLELENGNQVAGNPKDLIDRFIEMNPRLEITRDRDSLPVADLSEQHTTLRVPLASETLAKIYIEQGYYSRAIEIYDKLCLKYPEKSSYFAGQIEKINDLIKNG